MHSYVNCVFQLTYRCLLTIWILQALIGLVIIKQADANLLNNEDVEAAHLVLSAIQQAKPNLARKALTSISDDLLRKTLTWVIFIETPSMLSFQEMSLFIKHNTLWPSLKRLRSNAEEAMPIHLDPTSIISWFKVYEPQSITGWSDLIEAFINVGNIARAQSIIKFTWINKNFNKSQERHFYKRFGKYLDEDDHTKRVDRLLWHGSYWSSKRMFYKLKDGVRQLAEARFLLRHMEGNVDKAILRVPKSLHNNPGLIYERIRWRREKGKYASARRLMHSIPKDYTFALGLLAKERIILTRQALRDGLITEAYRLIVNHKVKKSDAKNFSEVEWLAGWIALEYLDEPEWAYEHFVNVHNVVKYPISVARASFWAGRAAQKIGNYRTSTQWYTIAGQYFTTFYGQLALSILEKQKAKIKVQSPVLPSNNMKRKFDLHELVKAAKLLHHVQANEWIKPFILQLHRLNNEPSWKYQTASLAHELKRPDLAIQIAKSIERRGHYMLHLAYPVIEVLSLNLSYDDVKVEDALVLAVIRQESRFYGNAVSASGAIGMMQLMPSTAIEVAERLGLTNTPIKLWVPKVNLTLGQAYLSRLLKIFDGSYILALSAYNAGPSRSKKWFRYNNNFTDLKTDPINWIESIPFRETRNYIHRVMENLQIYRSILSDNSRSTIGLEADLMR